MPGKFSLQAKFLLKRPSFTLDIELKLPASGVTVIQGPSGCGKTTILRCIAGLEQPDEGYLRVNDKVWQDERFFLSAYKRPIGYVFQEDSLFEHLNVLDNILFGCKERRRMPADMMPVIQMLGISHLLERRPAELSGGERQRAAIARALAVKPEVLLMDEPLPSLDRKRKAEILPFLEQIRDLHRTPIIYVTHDRAEAERLATRLIEVDNGSLASVQKT